MNIQEIIANKINLGYTRNQIETDLLKQYSQAEINEYAALLNTAKTELTVEAAKKKNVLKILGYIAIGLWLFFKVFIKFFRFSN